MFHFKPRTIAFVHHLSQGHRCLRRSQTLTLRPRNELIAFPLFLSLRAKSTKVTLPWNGRTESSGAPKSRHNFVFCCRGPIQAAFKSRAFPCFFLRCLAFPYYCSCFPFAPMPLWPCWFVMSGAEMMVEFAAIMMGCVLVSLQTNATKGTKPQTIHQPTTPSPKPEFCKDFGTIRLIDPFRPLQVCPNP